MRHSLPTLATTSILATLLLTTGIATAADDTFTGAGGGSTLNWFNLKNWDTGHLPAPEDNALILVPKQTEANPAVIDNTADPAYKDKRAVAARLVVGDGDTAFLTIKSNTTLSDGLRLGTSDVNHNGNGTVTQTGGTFDPGSSPSVGATSGLTGTYYLQGGAFSVGDTNLMVGGNTDPAAPAGVGSFVVSGGKLIIGSRLVFGNGGGASFTVIGSQATLIQIGDQLNEDSAGLVNLNVQIDKGGLTQINTDILGLKGITLSPPSSRESPPTQAHGP